MFKILFEDNGMQWVECLCVTCKMQRELAGFKVLEIKEANDEKCASCKLRKHLRNKK